MNDKININKNIVFIGMPGAGKTSVGKAVSQRLQLPFYDVDTYIENKEGQLIKDIFQQYGEEHFRRLESEAIIEVSKNCPSIISTGGGTVKISSNMEVLKSNSIIIFLNRPIENIIKDIDISVRPLLAGDVSKIYNLFKERYPLYKKYCDIEIINDMDFNSLIDEIIKCIRS
ncbi:shikimate kinase [Caloramator sp. E03]|uniref:shikimate kinase n=1 Tax=Caloramator sp. E03 TaxID=2576307 RepID=UPI001110A7CD|nr:shikimate kinase [Caloramator sp. E03]QCX34710.1 shikimate kinase [Caloramator sp. E03]